MSYDSFFRSKGRGFLQIAEIQDEHRDRTLRVYFIGEDTNVGINDGVDVWIACADSSLYGFPKNYLREQIQKAKEGKIPKNAFEQKVRVRNRIRERRRLDA